MPKARRITPSVTSLALGALVVHALDAWVVQVKGDTSLPRRSIFLACVAAGALFAVYARNHLFVRLRALATLVTGLIALVVVGPITGSALLKQGWGGSVFSGVLATVGAIVLTVSGARRLVRIAGSRSRKLLALPVALVMAQFFVLPVGMAVLATQAARPPLGSRTPADVGLRYEDVTITARDGTPLAAWYVPSHNGSMIVLRHGSGSTRTNLLEHAGFLGDAGYGVLLMDARGHGESGGRINELGWHGPSDIAAALDYLEARGDVTGRIGVLGLSMGGEEALNAAGGDNRIAAVAAEGVGTSNYDDSVAAGANAIARLVNWTQFAVVGLLSDAPRPPGIVASMPRIAPRPVLLITGDEAVEKTMGPLYAEAGRPTAELWQLPDAPHTQGLRVHPVEYVERVLGFFDDSLLNAHLRSTGR